jgi:AcrR family transcriptional regulator
MKRRKSTNQKTSPGAAETRAALMDSALKHFAANGFFAASVHDIARDAGVNVSLVSYHFGGKEGLFKSCLERVGSDQLHVAVRVLSKEPETIDEIKIRLEMFVDEMLLYGIKHPDMLAILDRDLNSEFHLIEDIFKKTFLNVFQLLSDFIDKAKERKLLADWIDPNLSAAPLMGAILHILKTDSIRSKIFNRSIVDEDVRNITRDYIVKSHLFGMLRRD